MSKIKQNTILIKNDLLVLRNNGIKDSWRPRKARKWTFAQRFCSLLHKQTTWMNLHAHINTKKTSLSSGYCPAHWVLSRLGSDLRFFYTDTMNALLVGPSAAHQRVKWFDLDKRERERVCLWRLWGAPFIGWTHFNYHKIKPAPIPPASSPCWNTLHESWLTLCSLSLFLLLLPRSPSSQFNRSLFQKLPLFLRVDQN